MLWVEAADTVQGVCISIKAERNNVWKSAMDCFYINLDSADQRKFKIENNFDAYKKPGWNLFRFSAIDKEHVETQNILGHASPAEKGCFLSHKILIGQNLADDRTFFILEDDAAFGIRTCTLIDTILSRNKNLDWDILFTDICIPQVTTMRELLTYRRDLRAKKIQIAFMDLSSAAFAGSTAYLVNGKSKQKIYDLLNSVNEINLPYDLYLRRLIHTSVLKAYALFPFVTSLSEFSGTSQIRSAQANPFDAVGNLFRKMIWTERNLEGCKSALELLKGTLCNEEPLIENAPGDEELSAFNILFSSMASIQTPRGFSAGWGIGSP